MVRLLENAALHVLPFTQNFELITRQYVSNQTVCDPVTPSQFADAILSPADSRVKRLFLKMLETYRIDMAITFAAGGHGIVYPPAQPGSLYDVMAKQVTASHLRENYADCPASAQRTRQADTLQRFTEFLLKAYQLPLFTLRVSCCQMPVESEIAAVWRHAIHRVLNFLRLVDTGVKGTIRDGSGAPVRDAIVSIADNSMHVPVTKNLAHFRFVLPAGQYVLRVSSKVLGMQSLPFNLIDGQTLDLSDIRLGQGAANEKYRVAEPSGDGALQWSDTVRGATLTGLVLDTRNRPIKDAHVTLTNSKSQSTNRTDYMGRYKLRGLPLGTITLQADAYGYQTATK